MEGLYKLSEAYRSHHTAGNMIISHKVWFSNGFNEDESWVNFHYKSNGDMMTVRTIIWLHSLSFCFIHIRDVIICHPIIILMWSNRLSQISLFQWGYPLCTFTYKRVSMPFSKTSPYFDDVASYLHFSMGNSYQMFIGMFIMKEGNKLKIVLCQTDKRLQTWYHEEKCFWDSNQAWIGQVMARNFFDRPFVFICSVCMLLQLPTDVCIPTYWYGDLCWYVRQCLACHMPSKLKVGH